MKPLIWIIDDEWESYAIETKVIQEAFPNAEIVVSAAAIGRTQKNMSEALMPFWYR